VGSCLTQRPLLCEIDTCKAIARRLHSLACRQLSGRPAADMRRCRGSKEKSVSFTSNTTACGILSGTMARSLCAPLSSICQVIYYLAHNAESPRPMLALHTRCNTGNRAPLEICSTARNGNDTAPLLAPPWTWCIMSGGAGLLEAERDRLQNAVLHLEESNVQLRAAVAQEADSDLREAVGVRALYGWPLPARQNLLRPLQATEPVPQRKDLRTYNSVRQCYVE